MCAKARIASRTSLPIPRPPSIQVPQQRQTPMFGLLAISMARLYPSKFEKMQRGTPPSMGCGGSSGWMPMRTPASSATGTTFLMKYV